MRLEVLVPCHDSARVLERAFRSILAQGRPADRITLHDDASTDGTPGILSRLQAAHPQVTVLRAPRNVGILASRQRLVAEAQGDVLCFLDHDDAWPEGHLARMEAALADPGAAVAVAPAVNLDGGGRVLSRVRPGPAALRTSDRGAAVREIFLRYPVPTWSCVALRRDAAARLAELEGFPSGEEFALLALALEHGDVVFPGGPDVLRHVGGGNAILDAARQQAADLAIFRWFAGRYPGLAPDLPAKLTAIYANGVYRQVVGGDVAGARATFGALLGGILHPKVLGGLAALVLGPRLLRWLRPAR